MSDKSDKIVIVNNETEKINKPAADNELDAVIIKTVETASVNTKKCCCQVKEDTCICLRCAAKTWSLCLNGFEGCFSALSTCCLLSSSIAIGCNKCLEQIDCDGH